MRNKQIAQNIVKFIFFQIGRCIKEDRSMIKLSWMEKTIINGMLSDKSLLGIQGYIANMSEADIKELLDGIKFQIGLMENDKIYIHR